MITLDIPELKAPGALDVPVPVTVNDDVCLLVNERNYDKLDAALQNIKALEKIKKARIARKVELAKSLFGILPPEPSFEEVMEERLSKI